ncbi:myotubularin-related protein 14 [Sergentomyia squamirostris]
MSVEVTPLELEVLLRTFIETTYAATSTDIGPNGFHPVDKCADLMKLDYSLIEIPNQQGQLCSHYPSRLLIPEAELRPETNDNVDGGAQNKSRSVQHLKDAIMKARFARCRSRFPVPVLLFKGKLFSRAATISGGAEVYGRSSLHYFFFGVPDDAVPVPEKVDPNDEETKKSLLADAMVETEDQPKKQSFSDWELCDRVRQNDIKLLQALDTEIIVDFMVEKKKVKFGMNVTSSEKVDKENRYEKFRIINLPYPGCEFFRVFRDNNFNGEGLVFNWNQSYVDASICVPEDPLLAQLPIEWDQYKLWDLVTITQNYLKLLLKYIQDGSTGMVIHCISGWDRTPLFASLVRLSLWADGLIHQSLSPMQMLYLTVAYDWYLFGHKLSDRLRKGEDIFFFCFYFLKFIVSSEFSALDERAKSKTSSGGSMSSMCFDNDARLDNMLETESRGSTFSLNSISSLKSNNEESLNGNSHGQWTSICLEGSTLQLNSPPHSPNNSNSSHRDSANSPPYKSRTSPMSVPSSSVMQRQHQESSSSASVGSWQMISGTGSVRSLGSDFCGANNPNANNQDSSSTAKAFLASQITNETTRMRAEKLNEIRKIFYTNYCTQVPHFKNGKCGKGMLDKIIESIY